MLVSKALLKLMQLMIDGMKMTRSLDVEELGVCGRLTW
jgi:hypothetical protein